jgi:hypothetical protein
MRLVELQISMAFIRLKDWIDSSAYCNLWAALGGIGVTVCQLFVLAK